MTIRLQNIVKDSDVDTYLRAPKDGFDILDDPASQNDMLAMVRHIMRDEQCTIIPVVHAFVTHPVNQYGHNVQIEVTYARRGWRAIYAGHAGGRLTNVQCYMD